MRIGIRFSPQRGINAGSQNTIAQHLIPSILSINPDSIIFTAAPEHFEKLNNAEIVHTRGFYNKKIFSILAERIYDQIVFENELLKHHCDVVYYPYTHESLFYTHTVPQVVTVHDVIPLVYPGLFPLMSKQWKYMTSPTLRRSAGIIIDAGYTRKDVVELVGVSPSKIHVVPLGFRTRQSINTEYKYMNKSNKYILYVSSSRYPYKNIEKLCSAFYKISHQIPHELIIVGKSVPRFSGDLATNLENNPARDRIHLLEELDNNSLEGLYANADLFVYPSLYEGFGIPPLEAMSFGIPVAASNATTIPEVCGDAAYYFDPESEDEMALAMLHCLEDDGLRASLIAKGNIRKDELSWDLAAKKIIDVCHAVAFGRSLIPSTSRDND